MKLKVDRELCTGVSDYVAVGPTVFKLDEQSKTVVLDPGSVDQQTLMEAARSCPENGILLDDDEGNQSYH